MATYTKNEIAEILTETTMSKYQDFNGIVSYVTDNKLCSNANSETTLSLDGLVSLLDLHFKSLDVAETLNACSLLEIRATYNKDSGEYHVLRNRQRYLIGMEVNSTVINDVEMSVIKSDDGLMFCVESSYLEQDVDAIISPYNNGLVVLKDN